MLLPANTFTSTESVTPDAIRGKILPIKIGLTHNFLDETNVLSPEGTQNVVDQPRSSKLFEGVFIDFSEMNGVRIAALPYNIATRFIIFNNMSLSGVTTANSNNGFLYLKFNDTTLELYKLSSLAPAALVASSSFATVGSKPITQQNASGITGTVDCHVIPSFPVIPTAVIDCRRITHTGGALAFPFMGNSIVDYRSKFSDLCTYANGEHHTIRSADIKITVDYQGLKSEFDAHYAAFRARLADSISGGKAYVDWVADVMLKAIQGISFFTITNKFIIEKPAGYRLVSYDLRGLSSSTFSNDDTQRRFTPKPVVITETDNHLELQIDIIADYRAKLEEGDYLNLNLTGDILLSTRI